MTTETNESRVIDQHIAKLHLETTLIAGEQRLGHIVSSSFFIGVVDNWGVGHVPSNRWLVRDGLTRRQAFDRAMELFNKGRDVGLQMHNALPQISHLTPDQLRALPLAARQYIEELERLLADK